MGISELDRNLGRLGRSDTKLAGGGSGWTLARQVRAESVRSNWYQSLLLNDPSPGFYQQWQSRKGTSGDVATAISVPTWTNTWQRGINIFGLGDPIHGVLLKQANWVCCLSGIWASSYGQNWFAWWGEEGERILNELYLIKLAHCTGIIGTDPTTEVNCPINWTPGKPKNSTEHNLSKVAIHLSQHSTVTPGIGVTFFLPNVTTLEWKDLIISNTETKHHLSAWPYRCYTF